MLNINTINIKANTLTSWRSEVRVLYRPPAVLLGLVRKMAPKIEHLQTAKNGGFPSKRGSITSHIRHSDFNRVFIHMTELEKAALDWFDKRQTFLDAEDKAGTPEFRTLLNECSKGEHALADAVRKYREQPR